MENTAPVFLRTDEAVCFVVDANESVCHNTFTKPTPCNNVTSVPLSCTRAKAIRIWLSSYVILIRFTRFTSVPAVKRRCFRTVLSKSYLPTVHGYLPMYIFIF
jgi:hypothetical protein